MTCLRMTRQGLRLKMAWEDEMVCATGFRAITQYVKAMNLTRCHLKENLHAKDIIEVPTGSSGAQCVMIDVSKLTKQSFARQVGIVATMKGANEPMTKEKPGCRLTEGLFC